VNDNRCLRTSSCRLPYLIASEPGYRPTPTPNLLTEDATGALLDNVKDPEVPLSAF